MKFAGLRCTTIFLSRMKTFTVSILTLALLFGSSNGINHRVSSSPSISRVFFSGSRVHLDWI
eukprot:TCALIF_12712-PA protein Name:"Protein of unknown function" AED:0.63 eAED:0.63 QI:0/0/0/0.5/0/0.5/2/0/61